MASAPRHFIGRGMKRSVLPPPGRPLKQEGKGSSRQLILTFRPGGPGEPGFPWGPGGP